MFASYESEFLRLLEKSREGIGLVEAGRQSDLAACQKGLNQADQTLRQMEMEVRTVATEESPMKAKALEYRNRWRETNTKLKEVKLNAERLHLLEGGEAIQAGGPSGSQRLRLLSVTEAIDSGTEKLQDSRKLALETEDVGVQILGDLRSQRETILRTRTNVGHIAGHLEEARRTISNMVRRAWQNRMLLTGIVCVLGLTFLMIAVVKLGRFWRAI